MATQASKLVSFDWEGTDRTGKKSQRLDDR
jgi:hypothetical protein